MNKTVTINISGIIFHIEEDAYETLSKYLSTIRGYFHNAQDKEEIMSDIEARIAELLKEKVSDFKQVVLMTDVDYVMNIMGKPEDFAGDEDQSSNNNQETYYTNPNRKRRFFRDPDDKLIGGVCSGVANYFDWDPTIIRIVYAILALTTFGFLFAVYILLWIILPEAKTTAEKLEMRGESIDINNISKTVKEEAEQLKERVKKFGESGRVNRTGERLGEAFKQFFTIVFMVLGKFVGALFMVFGIGLMIGVIAIFMNKASIDGTNAQLYVDDFLITNKFFTFIGIILLMGVPAIMLLYKGFKMVFGIKYHNKWLNIGSGILWTIGIIMLTVTGINAAKEFSEEGKIKTPYQLQNAKMDTLYVSVDLNNKLLEMYDSYEEVKQYDKMRTGGINDHGFQLIDANGEKRIYGATQVNIVESATDSFEVNIIKRARGSEKKPAMERAKKIAYSIKQNDSLLIIDPLFSIDKDEKLREQEVIIQIRVPKGKVVKLDKSLYSFLHDVDNVSNTWDGDMVDRRWIMTLRGLECIDCNGLNLENVLPLPSAPPMPPMPGEININDNDAKVKMNEKGIDIKSKDATIKIDENGIKIETKNTKKKED
ncbi:MAG: PspC domain-containing protein [Bacteroidota bacterium]|nr:PspC domain-containing protein [Bacteroidota bacterium]